jgi:hypothetical protein
MQITDGQFLWKFLYKCITKNIIFSDQDCYNLARACNIKLDSDYVERVMFHPKSTNTAEGSPNVFVVSKSLLGPCYMHPKGVNPRSANYNISKIIYDLQLGKQNISPDDKMNKIIDYIQLLG